MPKRRRYDDRLHIDISFGEAVERFVGTRPAEMHANIKKAKKKKPPGGKKAPSGGNKRPADNIVSLRDRRTSKRNYGR